MGNVLATIRYKSLDTLCTACKLALKIKERDLLVKRDIISYIIVKVETQINKSFAIFV